MLLFLSAVCPPSTTGSPRCVFDLTGDRNEDIPKFVKMVFHRKLKWESFAERDRVLGLGQRWGESFRGPDENLSRITEQSEHYNFVEGRGNLSLRRFRPDQSGEWIPDILPAPVRALSGVQGYSYGDQEESQRQRELQQPRTRTRTRTDSVVGHEINYFSDGTEGVQEAHATSDQEYQEGETYPDNKYSIHRAHQGHQDQFSSKGNQSIPRSRPRSASEPFAPQTFTATREDMAGRGRGRGGGGNMLKGATWEYDPSIKLESKPTELFPVSISLLPSTQILTLSVTPKSEKTCSHLSKRKKRNRQLQISARPYPSWLSLYPTYQARSQCPRKDLWRGTIQ